MHKFFSTSYLDGTNFLRKKSLMLNDVYIIYVSTTHLTGGSTKTWELLGSTTNSSTSRSLGSSYPSPLDCLSPLAFQNSLVIFQLKWKGGTWAGSNSKKTFVRVGGFQTLRREIKFFGSCFCCLNIQLYQSSSETVIEV